MHLKEVGLCCNIFLGYWCLYVVSGAATANLKKVNKKMKDFRIVYLNKYGGVPLTFLSFLITTEKHSA